MRNSLHCQRVTTVLAVLSLLFIISALPVSGASAQARLDVSTSASGADRTDQAGDCVRLTQDEEWVSDPILSHPLIPFIRSEAAAFGTFAGIVVLLYLALYALFVGRIRNGANPLSAFGQTMAIWIFLVGVAGYFMTGHLSYAESWCVDRSGGAAAGAPPARSNAEIEKQFGASANEIADRGAIPIEAHLELTPWYFWVGGMLILGFAAWFGFRSSSRNDVQSQSSDSDGTQSSSPEVW